ncbi:hypothetical protein [Nocardia sp. NPDC059239]|uniref:hypothetical protein n=1 Tax=Nocardia sp. NPDC059239 TaxID=3346785 RepID=UPI00368B2C9B
MSAAGVCRRNSFNDLLILATALRWGLAFKTDDRLLLELALRAGMIQTSYTSGVASLRPPVDTTGTSGSLESPRYINSRWGYDVRADRRPDFGTRKT